MHVTDENTIKLSVTFARQVLSAYIGGYAIERRIDEARLGFTIEGAGDFDIFVDDHLEADIRAELQFPGAGAQDGADRRIEALDAPAGSQAVDDQRIDRRLLFTIVRAPSAKKASSAAARGSPSRSPSKR